MKKAINFLLILTLLSMISKNIYDVVTAERRYIQYDHLINTLDSNILLLEEWSSNE